MMSILATDGKRCAVRLGRLPTALALGIPCLAPAAGPAQRGTVREFADRALDLPQGMAYFRLSLHPT